MIRYLNHGSNTTNLNHHSLHLSFLITKTTSSFCMCLYLSNKRNQTSCSKLATKMGDFVLNKERFFGASKTYLKTFPIKAVTICGMHKPNRCFWKSLDISGEIIFQSKLHHVEAAKFFGGGVGVAVGVGVRSRNFQ